MLVGEILPVVNSSLKIRIVNGEQDMLAESQNGNFDEDILLAEVIYFQPEWNEKVLRVEVQ